MLYGGMNGGGIPGGPMPIGAEAMKPGGMDPGVKPIWDDGGNAGGGIIGGATRVFSGTPAFGESIANSTISDDTSIQQRVGSRSASRESNRRHGTNGQIRV